MMPLAAAKSAAAGAAAGTPIDASLAVFEAPLHRGVPDPTVLQAADGVTPAPMELERQTIHVVWHRLHLPDQPVSGIVDAKAVVDVTRGYREDHRRICRHGSRERKVVLLTTIV